MVSSFVSTSIRVYSTLVMFFMVFPLSGTSSTSQIIISESKHLTNKIIIDSPSKQGSDLDMKDNITLKTLKVVTVSVKQSRNESFLLAKYPKLALFGFYFKSDPKICPCWSIASDLDFADEKSRSEYLTFLENQQHPARIEENTQSLLESVMEREIEAIKAFYLKQKEVSLAQVKEKKSELIEEMVIRSLRIIKENVFSSLSLEQNEEIESPAPLAMITSKTLLLENLDKSSRLTSLLTLCLKTFSNYLKLISLHPNLQEKLTVSLWNFFPKEELNSHALATFSKIAQPNQGMVLVINNPRSWENEPKNEALKYAQFLDIIWNKENKESLYDEYKNSVVWVYKDVLNLWKFQELFKSLNAADLEDSPYFSIFRKMYNIIVSYRVQQSSKSDNQKSLISEYSTEDEKELLKGLVEHMESVFDQFFVSKEETEQYLLIITIIFNRLKELGEEVSYAHFKNDLVVDNGLPLKFYVKRNDLRRLLKNIVKENKLDVNLNILKYSMDQLVTKEDFKKNSKQVLFDYLEGLFSEEISSEDKLEILENLEDLLLKSDMKNYRGRFYRKLSIRYVYFKYHFNYLLGIENKINKETQKFNYIVNIERMDFLRPILEIVFKYISDDSQVLMETLFRAVEMMDESFTQGYSGMQLFLSDNFEGILNRIVIYGKTKKVKELNHLCRLMIFDFDSFIPQNKALIYVDPNSAKENEKSPDYVGRRKRLIKECSELEDFSEVNSFRNKYFIQAVKMISLVQLFTDYPLKRNHSNDYIELYVNQLFFREFGIPLDMARYHYALEFDSFLSAEVKQPKLLSEVKELYLPSSQSHFDIIKIANMRNLINFPKLLTYSRFNFIFFKKIGTVLRFFNLTQKTNLDFINTLYNNFKNKPFFYHFNNIYFLLKMQYEIDQEPENPERLLTNRLQSIYNRVNVFDSKAVAGNHNRTIILASRIAVIYFYTIYLQSSSETTTNEETRAEFWKSMEEFLKQILTNETRNTRLYFFTDYLYDNLSTQMYSENFENNKFDREEFLQVVRAQPENYTDQDANRRELSSWAYEYLTDLDYKNSPARYLENAAYSFYKELLLNRNFDKAEDMKELMIENALAFHRRNGHKVLFDLMKTLLSNLKMNPRIPSQNHMNLVLFNCVAEFIAMMNSPDKKYHEFLPQPVMIRFIKFIFEFFKSKGTLHNERLYMPVTERYINIGAYSLPHIISLFSIFKLDITKILKPEVIKSQLKNIEMISWKMFAPKDFLSSISENEDFEKEAASTITQLKKFFRPHELNNLTTQNLEGFFKPICHFEDALVSMRFIESEDYLKRLEQTIPECLEIIRKSGPSDSRRILSKVIKTFYIPEIFYKESVTVFEDDQLPDYLVRVKKLFARVTMTAQETIDFYEYGQMLQKVLTSQAKVVNSNFQVFLADMLKRYEITELYELMVSDLNQGGPLTVDESLINLPVEESKRKMERYYTNSMMYDLLTLLPINSDTIKTHKSLWQFDFFHLLNRKSSYASYLTNLFQNYSQGTADIFPRFYFLICKFKLVQLLKEKNKTGKLHRSSLVNSSLSVTKINQKQEEITLQEAPVFNSFLKNIMTSSNPTDKDNSNPKLLSELYYLKITNIDTNLVDMKAFELNEEYAVSVVQGIRSLLAQSDLVSEDTLAQILQKDQFLTNNLSFYYQEAKKLDALIKRYGDIDYKFEETQDNDVQSNYKDYISQFVSLFEKQYGLKVSDEKTVMYKRNLKTLLFKFDSKVVF